MELVYVTVLGALIGTSLRYALPRRSFYGIVLLPAIGAGVTAVVWVALLWAGQKFDGGWIWVISLGAATAVSIAVALLLSSKREAADRHELHVLSGGKASAA